MKAGEDVGCYIDKVLELMTRRHGMRRSLTRGMSKQVGGTMRKKKSGRVTTRRSNSARNVTALQD